MTKPKPSAPSRDVDETVRALRAEADSKRRTAEVLSTESQRHFSEAARLIRVANSLEGGGGHG
jgi:hypothetical protein